MSSLSVDFLSRVGARDTIPEEHKVPELKTSSLITERQVVKFVPSNGNSFQPNQVIYIRLNSTGQYIVPSSAGLVVDLHIQNSDTSQAWTPMDISAQYTAVLDNICAWLDKARLTIGGVQVEEILNAGKVVNAMATTTMSQAHASQTGGYLYDYWKYNTHAQQNSPIGMLPEFGWPTDLSGDYSGLPPGLNNGQGLNPVGPYGVNQRGRLWYALQSFKYNNPQFTPYRTIIPLSFLFGFFRSHKLFNLRNVGNIEIQLFTNRSSSAIVVPGAVPVSGALGTPVTAVTGAGAGANGVDASVLYPVPSPWNPQFVYRIDQCFVLADLATLNPSYVNVIDALVASEDGLVSAIDTYTTLTATSPISATPSRKNYVFSFASPCLKSFTWFKQFTSDDGNYREFAQSGFRCSNAGATRLRIGTYFPLYDLMLTKEEQLYYSIKAQGAWGNVVDQLGLRTLNLDDNTTFAQWVNTIPLTKYTESADIMVDGLDCRLSGSVITLEHTSDTVGSASYDTSPVEIVYAVFEHLKILKQSNGVISVEES